MMGGDGGDALSTLPRSNVSTKCDGGYKHSMKLCCVAFYLNIVATNVMQWNYPVCCAEAP